MGRTLNTDIFIDRSIKKHGKKYSYKHSVYSGIFDKVDIFCNKCNEYFKQSAHDHMKGKGCDKCGGTKILTNNEFIKKSNIEHDNKYDYSKTNYINSMVDVEIICSIHGSFFQKPNKHLYKKHGCIKCKTSKGELRIMKILSKYNIENIHQKRFNGCKNKNPLPFDFYLPEYNICIEYQGEQHYKCVYFGENDKKSKQLLQKRLVYTQKHDKIKREYCKNNNITLIEIPYWDFKNIEKIIENVHNINISIK